MIKFSRKAMNSLKTLPESDLKRVHQILASIEDGNIETLPPGKRPMLMKTALDKKIYVARVSSSLRLVYIHESAEEILVIDVMNHDRMAGFFKSNDQEGKNESP